MASPFLYSVNPLLKFQIQRDYYGHRHFVWCADCFDSRRVDALHTGASVPPSSNPAEILASVRAAVQRSDHHNKDIRDWKVTLKQRALTTRVDGKITADQEQEIIYLIDNADIQLWRPLLYIINRTAVEPRLQEVPVSRRANPSAKEYQIVDLAPDEFDAIEPST
jgi:hypothetical protein